MCLRVLKKEREQQKQKAIPLCQYLLSFIIKYIDINKGIATIVNTQRLPSADIKFHIEA